MTALVSDDNTQSKNLNIPTHYLCLSSTTTFYRGKTYAGVKTMVKLKMAQFADVVVKTIVSIQL